MMKSLSLLFIALLATPSTHASILLEPYGGYSVGSASGTQLSGTTVDESLSGGAYGGRAGFMLMHFFILAFDYQAISATDKQQGVLATHGWKQATEFATVGLQMPFGFRLLGSYGFKLNVNEDSSPTPTTYTGTAYKAGVGWMILHNVAINAEYSVYNLNNYTQNSVTNTMSSKYSKFNYSATMVSLSIPFTFFHLGGGRHSSGNSESGDSGGGGKTRGN